MVDIVIGNRFCDDRGYLSFINDLDLSKYKRFYTVENHKCGFIRAWHGHKEESKAVICLKGAALISLVPLDTPQSEKNAPFSVTLTGNSPKAVIIPAGYYNGAMNLTDDCMLMYMSDKSLGESHGDDYRQPWDYFGKEVWEVIYR